MDLETGAVVGVTVQDAGDGDTTTMVETLLTEAEQLDAVLPAVADLTDGRRQGVPQQPDARHIGGPQAAQLCFGPGALPSPRTR